MLLFALVSHSIIYILYIIFFILPNLKRLNRDSFLKKNKIGLSVRINKKYLKDLNISYEYILFMMINKILYWKIAQVSIILLSIITSIMFYDNIPEKVTIHWNSSGIGDNFVPKNIGLSIIPLAMILLFSLFLILPIIDPLKHNILEFRNYYEGLIVVLLLFLFIIHLGILLANSGVISNILFLIDISMIVLLYYLSILFSHVKRNWFVGIRTPWTLSNERIWNKTHKRASVLFKMTAIIMLFILLIQTPERSLHVGFLLLLIFITYLILYSYYLYYSQTKMKNKSR